MIRQFQPADAGACSELVRASLEQDPAMNPELRRHLLRLESPQAMLERARQFYVAVFVDGSAVVAVGGVEMNEIRLLYVAPGWQRRHIGQKLLRHLEEWVPAALFPDVFVYSATSATPFYQAQGYSPAGEHIVEVDGHPLPTVFMRKSLESGGRT